jgi:predicted RNA-binding protein with RPS1 domain
MGDDTSSILILSKGGLLVIHHCQETLIPMDNSTLRYVQQFGRSKRDNLRPSLLSKYHVGQTIEVYPFRIMDFGCFAATPDGLSGLLHNSEMTSTVQNSLNELVEKQIPIKVRIHKFDRRTGEIAFNLEDKKDEKKEIAAKTEDAAPTVAPTVAPAPAETIVEKTEPAAAVPVAAAETSAKADPKETAAETTTGVLEPHQFKTSQPVYPAKSTPFTGENTELMEREMTDIQKFLENVLSTQLSNAAKDKLRGLLNDVSVFKFTYAMQTVVDEFEPDPGVQLMIAIEQALANRQA